MRRKGNFFILARKILYPFVAVQRVKMGKKLPTLWAKIFFLTDFGLPCYKPDGKKFTYLLRLWVFYSTLLLPLVPMRP